MTAGLKYLMTILTLLLIIARFALVISEFEQLDGAAIQWASWNIAPLCLLAFFLLSTDKNSLKIIPLTVTALAVGSFTILLLTPSSGHDGLVLLFLPAWELISGAVLFVICSLIQAVVLRIRKAKQ